MLKYYLIYNIYLELKIMEGPELTGESNANEEILFENSYKGKIKDKYHFSQKLASGGFGIVYLAEERTTGKKFAIKAI